MAAIFMNDRLLFGLGRHIRMLQRFQIRLKQRYESYAIYIN
ncbi:hypothetical protein Hanom_Chr13g01241721 [Helianthus anomalus]